MSTSSEERGLDLAAVGAQSEEEQAHEESVVHGSVAWFAEVVDCRTRGWIQGRTSTTSPTRIC